VCVALSLTQEWRCREDYDERFTREVREIPESMAGGFTVRGSPERIGRPV